MYVVESEACSVASGEGPIDQARVDRERASRAQLEAGISDSYEAMERLVHRLPDDFAEMGGNFFELTKSHPGMVPERVPARHRAWPDGYRRECRLRQRVTPGVIPLRPIYRQPFPIATSTAPGAPEMKCALQAYRRPYPVDDTRPGVSPETEADNGGVFWALLLGAVALGTLA